MSRPPVVSQDFLSPVGALENRPGSNMRSRGGERGSVSQEISRDGPNLHSNSNNINFKANTRIPLPVSNLPRYCPTPSLPNDFWSLDRLDKPSNPGTEEQQRVTAATTSRRLSDQDIKTRSTRAALQFPSSNKHKKSSASYPIYFPSALAANSGFSSTPPFLPWGVAHTMEPRISPRPGSSGSSTTRSSFESRHKSPLSISSSVDSESSTSTRTSLASSRSSFADDFHSPTSPNRFVEGTQAPRELNGPALARYGAGVGGRQQKLLVPQRLSKNPQSPTNQTFGTKYAPGRLGEGFKKLPEEILLNCLAELKKLHLNVGSLSCSTCWMRDVVAVGGSCKKWRGAARSVLYEDIQLIGNDSVLHTKKRYKIKYGTRLKLLRRTLQARPDLAQYIKSLKVPALPEVAKNQKEKDEYMDLVASVIMACPNLERLSGFYPAYNHEFSRFVHAMSTRTRLREHVWIISGSPRQRQYQQKQLANSGSPTQGLLPPEQCIDFLTFHYNWSNLQTLVMHCSPDGTMNSPLFTDIFDSLPSLENLHISSFPAYSFDDTTLLSLPSLNCLRLENLPGITDHGLSNFASFARTKRLKSLALISLSLVSLPVLARLFSHLQYLTNFTLSQTSSPSGVEIFLHPYLASSTLEHMHWEFMNREDDKATEILSKSISCNGFPSLKSIRAPTDFEGSLQKLCKPKDRIELSADKYRNLSDVSHNGIPISQSMPSLPSPTRSTFSGTHSHTGSVGSSFIKSPTRSAFSLNMDRPVSQSSEPNISGKGMSLALARRMAQQRIDAATTKPQFHIIIWDENGQFIERHALGGFLGSIQSKISYILKPDLDGSDESLMGVEALLDGGEETNVRDGCTGSWNLDLGIQGGSASAGKKEKDRWRHSERGRWRPLSVENLF
ncbi:RNI-like protein [Venustampulla echinocandica]|uniref:RNI-like protein n=1 Tax=Venustampulla echinocandica TaxID=2656787 RepID=A0A370U336_9HELO|nr:RNI-like protein [Venustampulla echinocandica]RDL42182.1 RNI-like protein [Venustampulla echinocandica]